MAVISQAEYIVTHNHKDFPKKKLPCDIATISPDEFVFDMVTADIGGAMQALMQMSNRFENPPISVGQLLNRLANLEYPTSAAYLKSFL